MKNADALGRVFARLAAADEAAFMPFLQAGYPSVDATTRLMKAAADNGADIIELGLPFSDPIADGTVIQQSSFEALRAGYRTADAFRILDRARLSVPVVLMSYCNPVYARGLKRFLRDAANAGAAGLIIPDMPADAEKGFGAKVAAAGLETVFLAAPTTPPARFRVVAARSTGFVYYVSLTGVTGARESLPPGLRGSVLRAKRLTSKPVAVGFGISTPGQARQVARLADGVIVGSAVVRLIQSRPRDAENELAAFCRAMKAACVR